MEFCLTYVNSFRFIQFFLYRIYSDSHSDVILERD